MSDFLIHHIQYVTLAPHPDRNSLDDLFRLLDKLDVFERDRMLAWMYLALLEAPVDLVLHPRQSVLDLDFATLQREVAAVFRAVQKAAEKQLPAQTEPAKT